VKSLLPFVITGLVTGSLYGLAALGLVLTYRTSGVFNFGQGAIAAGAAFMFYTLHVTHHLAWPVAAALTLLAFAVVVGWI
jgi:branched-subunit amino acid ABC-type transport system permease component